MRKEDFQFSFLRLFYFVFKLQNKHKNILFFVVDLNLGLQICVLASGPAQSAPRPARCKGCTSITRDTATWKYGNRTWIPFYGFGNKRKLNNLVRPRQTESVLKSACLWIAEPFWALRDAVALHRRWSRWRPMTRVTISRKTHFSAPKRPSGFNWCRRQNVCVSAARKPVISFPSVLSHTGVHTHMCVPLWLP